MIARFRHLFRRRPKPYVLPSCYGSNPGPQARAENDCDTCQHEGRCALSSVLRRTPNITANLQRFMIYDNYRWH